VLNNILEDGDLPAFSQKVGRLSKQSIVTTVLLLNITAGIGNFFFLIFTDKDLSQLYDFHVESGANYIFPARWTETIIKWGYANYVFALGSLIGTLYDCIFSFYAQSHSYEHLYAVVSSKSTVNGIIKETDAIY
jgi:hypothetical protein